MYSYEDINAMRNHIRYLASQGVSAASIAQRLGLRPDQVKVILAAPKQKPVASKPRPRTLVCHW